MGVILGWMVGFALGEKLGWDDDRVGDVLGFILGFEVDSKLGAIVSMLDPMVLLVAFRSTDGRALTSILGSDVEIGLLLGSKLGMVLSALLGCMLGLEVGLIFGILLGESESCTSLFSIVGTPVDR